MIRIAVLGAGGHSTREHGPALKAVKEERPNEVELAAVCDLKEDKARAYAEAFGFERTYTDLDRMLDEVKPDGLVAVTPIVLTEPIITRLLPRGIPLLIEKPPWEDSEATRRLMDVARRTGTPHMVSFNRRFSPAIRKAREWLAAHAGDRPPHLVLGRMLRHRRREGDFAVGTGIHPVDAILSFLGPPEHVHARRTPGTVQGCFSFKAVLEFPGGRQALLALSPESGVLEETYEIHGTDYCIQVDTWQCRVRAFEGGEEVLSWRAPDDARPEFASGAYHEAAAFVRGVQEGEGLAPDLAEALASMRISEAIQGAKSCRLTP